MPRLRATSAPWGAVAAALDSEAFAKAVVHTAGFRFAELTDIYSARFLPGSVKYGDLPGLLPLRAPQPLWLAGESLATVGDVTAAYNALDQPTPDEDPHTQFPLERTYTEWSLSEFAAIGVDMAAGSAARG